MAARQIASHARRHAEIEAMTDDELRHIYRMTSYIPDPFDSHIGFAELRRRGIDPLTLQVRATAAGTLAAVRGDPGRGVVDACQVQPGTRLGTPYAARKLPFTAATTARRRADGLAEFTTTDGRTALFSPRSPLRLQGEPPASGSAAIRPAAALELPATDGEFLAACAQLGSVLTSLAREISAWADELAGLHLPPVAVDGLRGAAATMTDAAGHAARAAAAFREAFTQARQAGAGGLRITGDGPG